MRWSLRARGPLPKVAAPPWSMLRYSPDLDACELNAREAQLRDGPVLSAAWEAGVFIGNREPNTHDYYRATSYR